MTKSVLFYSETVNATNTTTVNRTLDESTLRGRLSLSLDPLEVNMDENKEEENQNDTLINDFQLSLQLPSHSTHSK